jgi:hypothetical protein
MNLGRLFLSIFLFLFAITIKSQVSQEFKIYYAPSLYNVEVQNLLQNNVNFKEYRLMLGIHIDPKKQGVIDREVFERNIIKFYPNTNSTGVLCLDLENKLFENLKNCKKESKDYKQAEAAFIWMVNTVKTMRPNLKIGIYGLPVRVYYLNSKEFDPKKFDKIFLSCDYIFPSLYTMYLDKQVGRVRNEKYLKDNLEIALGYGLRLHKPVIPFVWNLVHPSNKKDGGALIDKSEMLKNILFVKNFKFKGLSAHGIVWWDPDYKSFSNMLKNNPKNDVGVPKYLQSELLKEYLNLFMIAY